MSCVMRAARTRFVAAASGASGRSPFRIAAISADSRSSEGSPHRDGVRWGASHVASVVATSVSRRGLAARGKSKASAAATLPGKEEVAKPKKQLALAAALKQVEMTYGKGSVMQLGSKDVTKVDVIPTGSLSLDDALGIGGLPRGRVVEVYGPESSGKTTVALHVVAQCQKMGGTAVFIDAEHALDSAYAKAIGVDISELFLAQPDNGEQALDIVDTLVRSSAVDIVVIDSVAALVPKAELDGEMGDHHIALQARLMSQALRKLTAILNNSNCTLIFINQIRQKVGVVFGNADVTTGGMALRFYSSVRLEVRKGQAIKANGELVGTQVKIKVAKNKLAPPFGKAEVDVMFGRGFDLQGELLDLGGSLGFLSKSGAWFGVTSALGVEGTELFGQTPPWLMGQGREKAKAFLAANPDLASKLHRAIAERLASGGHSKASDPVIGDIPTDSPGLLTASEEERSEASAAGTGVGDGQSEAPSQTSRRETNEQDGVGSGEKKGRDLRDRYSMHGGVLLEPGVTSEAELMMSPPGQRVVSPKAEDTEQKTGLKA